MPLALLLALSAAAQPSTAPVFGAPLQLRFLVDHRGGPRGELGFALRWDVSDLPRLPRHVVRLAVDPFGTTQRAAREALGGADVGVYSLRLKAAELLPVDLLLSPLTLAAKWLRPPAALTAAVYGGEALPAPPPPDARRRLRLTPVRDQLERNLRRDARRALIDAGFDLVVPVPQSVSFAQKQAVLDSLRDAGDVWEEDWERIRSR